MEISQRVKDLLAKGETEKALNELVANARELGGAAEQQALLLSGQFKQWKRNRTLGIEQSSGELRRIEFGIMQVLELEDMPVRKDTPARSAYAATTATRQAGSPIKKFLPILLGLAVVALGAFYFMQSASTTVNDELSDPPIVTTDPTPPVTSEEPQEPAVVDVPAAEEKFPYATVELAGKTWMAANLNEPRAGAVCYGNDDYNCSKEGRLYTFSAARKACAALGNGWRLPTDADWKDLTRMYGGAYGDNGLDGKGTYAKLIKGGPTKFNASFGGKEIYIGDPPKFYFYDFGTIGYYWIDQAADDPSQARMMTFRSSDTSVLYETISNTDLISCRCVKD